jgi:hypothetical protein
MSNAACILTFGSIALFSRSGTWYRTSSSTQAAALDTTKSQMPYDCSYPLDAVRRRSRSTPLRHDDLLQYAAMLGGLKHSVQISRHFVQVLLFTTCWLIQQATAASYTPGRARSRERLLSTVILHTKLRLRAASNRPAAVAVKLLVTKYMSGS